MKKLAYIAIGAVFSLVLSYSFISWADNSTSSSQASLSSQQTVNSPAAKTIVGEISFLDANNGSIIVFDGKQKYACKIDSQTKVMIDQKEQSLQQLKLGDQVELVCNSEQMVRYIVLTKQATTNITVRDTAVSGQTTATLKGQTSTQPSVPITENEQNKHEDNGKHNGWYKQKDKGKEKEKKQDEHKDENEHDD